MSPYLTKERFARSHRNAVSPGVRRVRSVIEAGEAFLTQGVEHDEIAQQVGDGVGTGRSDGDARYGQQRRGGGFGFGGRGGLPMLLSNASVQEELKMDDAQKEKANELGEKTREKMMAAREELQGLDQEERHEADARDDGRNQHGRSQCRQGNAQARTTQAAPPDPAPDRRCECVREQQASPGEAQHHRRSEDGHRLDP